MTQTVPVPFLIVLIAFVAALAAVGVVLWAVYRRRKGEQKGFDVAPRDDRPRE